MLMVDINRLPDKAEIICEKSSAPSDALVSFERYGNMTNVKLTATASQPRFIRLRWSERTEGKIRIMGDAWERAYGTLEWKGIDPERSMQIGRAHV
mgnify:CR=1 FL=1